jgi:hypothetical protein
LFYFLGEIEAGADVRGTLEEYGALPAEFIHAPRRDACAAILPPLVPPAPVERHQERHRNGAGTERRYALAALQSEACYVEIARPGERNNTLNRAAFCVGTLIPSGGISASEVEAVLTSAALKAGLHASEIATTLSSGLAAGMNQPRRIGGTG